MMMNHTDTICALVGEERAIVSDIHGTTHRVNLSEDAASLHRSVDDGDITFRFIDTAGIRQTTDVVESIGHTGDPPNPSR